MKKTISIPYTLYESNELFSIPISYRIEVSEKSNVMFCNVDLPKDKIPTWLNLHEFNIRTVLLANGINHTHYNDIKGIESIDMALFINQVHDCIFTQEQFYKLY